MSPADRERPFTKIAQDELGVPTLEPRNMDALDFHDVSVHDIRRILQLAFDAGRADGVRAAKNRKG